MTEYDYLAGKKTVLTADGKTPHILIIEGFNDNVLTELGKKGYLRGDALRNFKNNHQEAHGFSSKNSLFD